MEKEQILKQVGQLRKEFQSGINNVHIWCAVAIQALEQVQNDEQFLNSRKFSVPSKRRGYTKTVVRKPEQVASIIVEAIDHELYDSVLVYLVAQVEAFFNDIISLVLHYDNRRLKTTVQGINGIKKLDISTILECESKETLVSTIIEQQLLALFYAGPSSQFEYLRRVVGVELGDDLQNDWIEYKATRDLIVHNSGVINQTYINKCGDFDRGQLGEKIVVDKDYFETAIAKMKALIGRISSQLQKLIRSDTEISTG